ncbi:MAG: NapC/NirT family cytochrome c [Burkholderiales bacterium]
MDNNKQEIVAKVRRNWKLVLGLGVLGLFVAVLLVIGGAAGLAWTSTEAFCTGCHEMRDNVYAEYKDTIHDRNRTGVRAICTDCHVPREPGPLILAKMRATWDLYGHITGMIDTKEKFEANRSHLAHKVWTRFLENDSHECRNCHKADKMDKDKQSEKAQARHAKAKTEGTTCIECHFGIAHKEPEGPGPQELKASLAK